MSTAISTAPRARRPLAPGVTENASGLRFGLFADNAELFDFLMATAAILCLFLNFGFGSIAIVGFLGATGVLVLRDPTEALGGIVRYWAIILFAVFATASTAWSNYPDLSLRGGVQLVLTIVAAVVIASRVNARQFIAAVFISTVVTCLFCLAHPAVHYGPEGVAFVGIMGSKNQMSFLAGATASAALAVAADAKHMYVARLIAAGMVIFGLVLLLAAKSAGGTVGLLASVGIFVVAVATIYMRQRVRIFLLASLLICSAPVLMVAPALEQASQDFIINVLHKDPTLTGRTYLWDRGMAIVAERPMLGVGHHAFWIQGEADAEGLWAYAGIGARSGFNFHNQYVDTLVTLGWVGLAILVLGLAVVAVGVGLESLIAPSVAGAFFLSNNIVSITRTFTETTLVAEWSFYTVIFYAGGIYAWRALRGAKAEMDPAAGPRGLRQRPGVHRHRPHAPARFSRGASPQG